MVVLALRRALALIVVLAVVPLVGAGCGRYAVRPDEKEFLADRIMQPDSDPVEAAHDQHILTNREGSAGGSGAGGGGCGCN